MKRACLTLVGLFAFLACNGTPSPPPRQDQARTSAEPAGYTLRIEFSGLVGFAKGIGQDSGKIWAFLVNAVYDPNNPDETLLPPGFLAEAREHNSASPELLATLMPIHYAWIRFDNANVTVTNPDKKFQPEKGRSIDGGDLRFQWEGQADDGPVRADLCHLSDIGHVAKALSSEPESPTLKQLRDLDELDPALLKTPLDRRLAARVLVEAGTMHTLLIGHNMHGDEENDHPRPAKLSYKTGFYGCPGQPEDAVELATQVNVVQSGLTGKVTVYIGPEDSIEIEPQNAAEPVVIEIFNDIAEVRDGETVSMDDYVAAQGFRWYYRLVPRAAQEKFDHHYYPCYFTLGPPKCFQKGFVIRPGGPKP
jgi:hypothetical protein